MPNRQKILILENDDFLREIIGNLLHKKGGYILNGFSVEDGLSDAQGHHINTVIIGSSCPDFKGKETLKYIKKQLGTIDADFFVINDGAKIISGIDKDQQMKTSELSIEKILKRISV